MNEIVNQYIKQSREMEQLRLETTKIEYEQSAAGRHEKILKEIADTVDRRAQIAEQEAASAKRDSCFSKVVSIVSILIALASLAFSALAFFLR